MCELKEMVYFPMVKFSRYGYPESKNVEVPHAKCSLLISNIKDLNVLTRFKKIPSVSFVKIRSGVTELYAYSRTVTQTDRHGDTMRRILTTLSSERA